jgi:hypothetical protein
MDFSRWLNSLSPADQLSILIIFLLSCLLSLALIKIGLQRYNEYRKSQPFAPLIRMTPFGFFSVAIPLTALVYLIFGQTLTNILIEIGI